MKQIPVQADNLTSLAAADFNEIPREEENAIQSSGQTLTSTDLEQLAKAIAIYAAQGDFYTDGGSANNYVLSVLGIQKSPPTYEIGMTIRFIPNFSNNSTTCIVNVASLGAIPVHVGQLANGGTPSVETGRIGPNKLYTLYYDETPDTLTKYFRLDQTQSVEIENVSLSKLAAGTAVIAVGNDTITIEAERVTIKNTSTGASMTIRAGSGAENAFSYSGGVGFRHTTVSNDGVKILDPQGASYRMQTVINGEGLSFSGGPGSNIVASMRTEGFSAASLAWTVDPSTARIFFSSTDLTITGIPWGTPMYGAFLEFIDTGGRRQICPIQCTFKDVGSVTTLDFSVMLGGADPTGGTAHIIWLTYAGIAID